LGTNPWPLVVLQLSAKYISSLQPDSSTASQMGRSTRRRPKPTGLARPCFQGSAGFPLGGRLRQRCSSMVHCSSYSGSKIFVVPIACWLVCALVCVGGALVVPSMDTDAPQSPLLVPPMPHHLCPAVRTIPFGCLTTSAPHMRSQPSNQMGDGPDLFEMGWLIKPPVVATTAVSPPPTINESDSQTPGAFVIAVS